MSRKTKTQHISNYNNIEINVDAFLENALCYSKKRRSKQCECIVYPHNANSDEWVLFVETKYANSFAAAFDPRNNYPEYAINQIKETDVNRIIEESDFKDGFIVVQKGKKVFLKIKIEVDVLPPSGFDTEIKYLYQPSPFAVRSYCLPDLLSGKLHAVLFRKWKNRIKGRDWYDLAWYAGKYPQYNLSHLENRARQSGDYADACPLNDDIVRQMLSERLAEVDIEAMKADVRPFLRDPRSLNIWNKDFFADVFQRLSGK